METRAEVGFFKIEVQSLISYLENFDRILATFLTSLLARFLTRFLAGCGPGLRTKITSEQTRSSKRIMIELTNKLQKTIFIIMFYLIVLHV